MLRARITIVSLRCPTDCVGKMASCALGHFLASVAYSVAYSAAVRASPSSNSGLVSSSTEPHLNTGHGVVRLWKERNGNGVGLCVCLVLGAECGQRTEERDGAAPLSCEVTWLIHGFPARL